MYALAHISYFHKSLCFCTSFVALKKKLLFWNFIGNILPLRNAAYIETRTGLGQVVVDTNGREQQLAAKSRV